MPDISPIAAVKLLREALDAMLTQFTSTLSTLKDSDARCLAHEALMRTASIDQPTSEEAVIVPDWPFCNPACDYEDPHGGMHDSRSAGCSCDAAKASIARQRAAAPPALPTEPSDAQNLATLREGLNALGWCAEFGALAHKVLNAPTFDQAEFETLVEKGTKAWAGVELVDGHVPAGAPVDERATGIPTWQDLMPAPRKQKYCTMNCGGGQKPCEDCGIEIIYGDPIVARDAEIAALRVALQQPGPAGRAETIARYEWMSNLKCNSLTISRDDHACNYVTAKQWIEEYVSGDFKGTDPLEIQAMKDTNTIWCVQFYPDTPISSYDVYGATLASAIDQVMRIAPPHHRRSNNGNR